MLGHFAIRIGEHLYDYYPDESLVCAGAAVVVAVLCWVARKPLSRLYWRVKKPYVMHERSFPRDVLKLVFLCAVLVGSVLILGGQKFLGYAFVFGIVSALFCLVSYGVSKLF